VCEGWSVWEGGEGSIDFFFSRVCVCVCDV